jgi:hypothetical protein
MFTVVHAIQEPSIGVLGAYTEVLVSWKERTDQAAVL